MAIGGRPRAGQCPDHGLKLMSDHVCDDPVQELIEHLRLQPHPEGGWYRETYRALDIMLPAEALPPRFGGSRHASTAIYYLLPAGARSLLHRIAADETWHFYAGGGMTLATIGPAGTAREVVLGPDMVAGQRFQYTVPGGTWFGGRPLEHHTAYALLGCTVAPGFDFADFELGARDALLELYPHCREIILRLTDPPGEEGRGVAADRR